MDQAPFFRIRRCIKRWNPHFFSSYKRIRIEFQGGMKCHNGKNKQSNFSIIPLTLFCNSLKLGNSRKRERFVTRGEKGNVPNSLISVIVRGCNGFRAVEFKGNWVKRINARGNTESKTEQVKFINKIRKKKVYLDFFPIT